MKPANERPFDAAICLASAIASRGRLDAGALAPGVAFDRDRQRPLGLRGRLRQSGNDRRVVGDDGDVDPPHQRGEPRHLLLADQVVADQDVVEPAVGHHFGFAELLAGDAFCAGVALERGQQRALVRLDVRAIGDACGVALRLHAGDVALDAVHVDDDGRCAVVARDLLGEGCRHGRCLGLWLACGSARIVARMILFRTELSRWTAMMSVQK